jgi:hypothetical protein
MGDPSTKERTMADGFVHTVSRDGRWGNTIEGDDQSLRVTYETKDDAVAGGRAEPQRCKSEHVIHRADGSIEGRNSYGNDRRHRPG